MFALHRGDLLCNSVVVKEKTSVSKLKEGGYGARELLPLDSVSEQVESTGPLLLLDEEVSPRYRHSEMLDAMLLKSIRLPFLGDVPSSTEPARDIRGTRKCRW
jgi:hypothetical protein